MSVDRDFTVNSTEEYLRHAIMHAGMVFTNVHSVYVLYWTR